jgi:hypothetical protein
MPVCWFTGAYFKMLFVQELLFVPAFFFFKAAIFPLYKQPFGVTKQMRIAVNTGLLHALLLYLPNILMLAITQALHIGKTWELMLTSDGGREKIYLE